MGNQSQKLGFEVVPNLRYLISRNVEGFSEIAKSIGESVFYSDDDLFIAARKIASENYGSANLHLLGSMQKIDIAKRLRYDYNASKKQIGRMLKITEAVLDALFQ
ncbi:MAG: hypothetical protein ACI3Y9_07950 [Candidatus Cryptobacteroides sp.]